MNDATSIPHPLPEPLVDLIAQRFRVIGEPTARHVELYFAAPCSGRGRRSRGSLLHAGEEDAGGGLASQHQLRPAQSHTPPASAQIRARRDNHSSASLAIRWTA